MYTSFQGNLIQSHFRVSYLTTLQDDIYKSIYTKPHCTQVRSRFIFPFRVQRLRQSQCLRVCFLSHSVFVKVAESSCEVPAQGHRQEVNQDEERERVKQDHGVPQKRQSVVA